MLDKEIGVNKDLEEVCSNVVELMNYGDWEKEYKRGKTVGETKVKSAQPTTRFYSLTFKESYLQALRQEATIEVSYHVRSINRNIIVRNTTPVR